MGTLDSLLQTQGRTPASCAFLFPPLSFFFHLFPSYSLLSIAIFVVCGLILPLALTSSVSSIPSRFHLLAATLSFILLVPQIFLSFPQSPAIVLTLITSSFSFLLLLGPSLLLCASFLSLFLNHPLSITSLVFFPGLKRQICSGSQF